MELLIIETYNDTTNSVKVAFRKLYVNFTDSKNPQIVVIFDEIHSGAAGFYTIPFTMIADNTTSVPVFRQLADGTIEPVMVEEEGKEPYQQTIGEFDMWRKLVFENNAISLNAAFEQGVRRRKGLNNDPLAFIFPE